MSRQFCEQCGQPLGAGMKFCEHCGAPVPGPVEAAPAAQIAPPSSAPPAAGRAAPVARQKWRVLAAGAAAFLVIAAGVAGFLRRDRLVALVRGHLPKPAEESQAPVPTPSTDGLTAAKDKTTAPAAATPAKAPVENVVPPAQAVTRIFPAQPFNGMQMEYRLEGASVDESKEAEGFTASRSLTGKVTGAALRVSGRLGMGSGFHAEARIRLDSGAARRDLPLKIPAGSAKMNWRDFDLSVPVQDGVAHFTIEMTGAYNVGERRLLLTGDFGAPRAPVASAAEAPHPPPVDDGELDSWFSRLPWVGQLQKSMPRGVTLSISAEPPDPDGWASVDIRENHAPDSGFDPNVSPMVGIFRVSKDRKVIEWMEPVSGDYEPLAGFLKKRSLQDTTGIRSPSATTDTTSAPKTGALSLVGGDFEGAPVKGDSAPVVAPDPLAPANHAAKIVGPDDMSFQLPVRGTLKAGAVTVSLRVLVPQNIRLQKWEDGRIPEGIRLRVRLRNPQGNSMIRDTVLRPTGAWRRLEMDFADPPRELKSVSVEAIWMEGAIYVDDVKIAPAP